ncbi:MAG: transcriptional repressor, partial [Candidatus Competibacteraceae bacterium]|nr:transcriptional repressor [Candidatus Competibacteraceae bacterium]
MPPTVPPSTGPTTGIDSERDTPSARRARLVLSALKDSRRPLSAYSLIDRLSENGDSMAPTQMYRVLGQLKQAGLILRVESQNGFIAAAHVHRPDEAVALLVCEYCGKVEEADPAFITPGLTPAALARGFTPHRSSLEVLGACGDCAGQTLCKHRAARCPANGSPGDRRGATSYEQGVQKLRHLARNACIGVMLAYALALAGMAGARLSGEHAAGSHALAGLKVICAEHGLTLPPDDDRDGHQHRDCPACLLSVCKSVGTAAQSAGTVMPVWRGVSSPDYRERFFALTSHVARQACLHEAP